MTFPSMWWIVANDHDPGHGWHWDRFFSRLEDPSPTFHWGGPDWLRSTTSIARVREMRRGDLVAAYQASEGILGLARLASDGSISPETGKCDAFDLACVPAVRLRTPIPLDVLRGQLNAREDFEFLRIVKQGSVFRVSPAGRDRLLSLSRQFNPAQHSRIDALILASVV